MYPGWHDAATDGWIWMMAAMMLFWALVIASVLAAFWWTTRNPDRARENAEQILRERLARSEIDVDEFEQRMDALQR